MLELPFGTFTGRAEIAGTATHGLDAFDATHHISANHTIKTAGDTARSRSYLLVTHVPDSGNPGRHGDAGGWYDSTYRREADGWRFTRVALSVIWTTGTDFPAG